MSTKYLSAGTLATINALATDRANHLADAAKLGARIETLLLAESMQIKLKTEESEAEAKKRNKNRENAKAELIDEAPKYSETEEKPSKTEEKPSKTEEKPSKTEEKPSETEGADPEIPTNAPGLKKMCAQISKKYGMGDALSLVNTIRPGAKIQQMNEVELKTLATNVGAYLKSKGGL